MLFKSELTDALYKVCESIHHHDPNLMMLIPVETRVWYEEQRKLRIVQEEGGKIG